MKMLKQFSWILGAGAVVLAAGCATSVNTVEHAQATAVRQMVADKRIITDASLNRAVRVVGVNETPGEFLKVQVELQNTTSRMKTFNYLFEWFDDKGMQISTPTATYIQRQIEGRESIFISSVAPTPKAKDFRLKLIEVVR
jgi:uncharacterized protein YcfL